MLLVLSWQYLFKTYADVVYCVSTFVLYSLKIFFEMLLLRNIFLFWKILVQYFLFADSLHLLCTSVMEVRLALCWSAMHIYSFFDSVCVTGEVITKNICSTVVRYILCVQNSSIFYTLGFRYQAIVFCIFLNLLRESIISLGEPKQNRVKVLLLEWKDEHS